MPNKFLRTEKKGRRRNWNVGLKILTPYDAPRFCRVVGPKKGSVEGYVGIVYPIVVGGAVGSIVGIVVGNSVGGPVE